MNGVVPFPQCTCGRAVSGLMRTTAGHYFLLHHGRDPWRCSVGAGRYADIAIQLADLHRRGARSARIVAQHQTQDDDRYVTSDPDQRELVERFRATLPAMDFVRLDQDSDRVTELYTEIFRKGVEAAFRALLPTHTRIDAKD